MVNAQFNILNANIKRIRYSIHGIEIMSFVTTTRAHARDASNMVLRSINLLKPNNELYYKG